VPGGAAIPSADISGGAEPRADDGRGNQEHHRLEIDLDDGHVDDRLEKRRERVAYVEGARDVLVAHEAEQPVNGRRGREGANSQRVQEVREEPDSDAGRVRCRPVAVAAPPRLHDPEGDVGENHDGQRREQNILGGQHG